MKNVMILTGAGQIGMAIARRMGYGKKIFIGEDVYKRQPRECSLTARLRRWNGRPGSLSIRWERAEATS